MRGSGWVAAGVLALVLGGSFWFLQGAAAGHPLAQRELDDAALRGALAAGPSGGVASRPTGDASALAGLRDVLPVCDLVTPAGPVSLAVATERALAAAGGGPGTDVEADGLKALSVSSGKLIREVPGPWTQGWIERGEVSGELLLHAEDNGVLMTFAGRVDEATLHDAARRAAEALRAVPP